MGVFDKPQVLGVKKTSGEQQQHLTLTFKISIVFSRMAMDLALFYSTGSKAWNFLLLLLIVYESIQETCMKRLYLNEGLGLRRLKHNSCV